MKTDQATKILSEYLNDSEDDIKIKALKWFLNSENATEYLNEIAKCIRNLISDDNKSQKWNLEKLSKIFWRNDQAQKYLIGANVNIDHLLEIGFIERMLSSDQMFDLFVLTTLQRMTLSK